MESPECHLQKRVIKLGGSLLNDAQVFQRFEAWLAEQPRAVNVVIVGGGAIVDAVRQLDQEHNCDPRGMHWRCIGLLSTTFELACECCPNWPAIETCEEFDAALKTGFSARTPTLVNVPSFLYPNSDSELPEGLDDHH